MVTSTLGTTEVSEASTTKGPGEFKKAVNVLAEETGLEGWVVISILVGKLFQKN